MLLKQVENNDLRKVSKLTLITDINVVCTLLTIFLGQFNQNFWLGGYMAIHMFNIGLEKESFGYMVTL